MYSVYFEPLKARNIICSFVFDENGILGGFGHGWFIGIKIK